MFLAPIAAGVFVADLRPRHDGGRAPSQWLQVTSPFAAAFNLPLRGRPTHTERRPHQRLDLLGLRAVLGRVQRCAAAGRDDATVQASAGACRNDASCDAPIHRMRSTDVR